MGSYAVSLTVIIMIKVDAADSRKFHFHNSSLIQTEYLYLYKHRLFIVSNQIHSKNSKTNI